MAQKITVALEDDLDGGPADETVRFGIGGAEYEIDLSKKNARALRRRLAPSWTMPVRLDGDHAAGPGAQPAAAQRRSPAWANGEPFASTSRVNNTVPGLHSDPRYTADLPGDRRVTAGGSSPRDPASRPQNLMTIVSTHARLTHSSAAVGAVSGTQSPPWCRRCSVQGGQTSAGIRYSRMVLPFAWRTSP